VAVCSKLWRRKEKKMRREEDQASRVFSGCIRKILLPSTTPTSQVKRPTSDISPDQQRDC